MHSCSRPRPLNCDIKNFEHWKCARLILAILPAYVDYCRDKTTDVIIIVITNRLACGKNLT